MHNAKIVNNKPICGNCGSDYISGIRDYKEVEMNESKYVMFQIRCYNCNEDNRYLANLDLEKTTRYEISSKIKDINNN